MIFAPGTTIAGRYRLKEELARGGMGAVWVAKHLQLDVDVAIKFMAPAAVASPVARGRFEREAKAAAQLRHPNIVHVYDFGFEGDTPYLVMELLSGEGLDERLKRERRLSLQAVAAILVQVAKGLRKAHEAGFVHRDLKPGNLFLSKSSDDEEDIVKILDFGIAKQTGADVESTKTGELIGSPHYMSPEQITDAKAIDGRSDLWSLGVILYRALTGELPFQGDSVSAAMANILTGPIPKPSNCLRSVPSALDGFFERAFARDKAQRFLTAREMTEAFLHLSGLVGEGAFAIPRDSGISWRVQQAPPVSRADAQAFEEATRVVPPSSSAPPPPSVGGAAPGAGQALPVQNMSMMPTGTITVSPSTLRSAGVEVDPRSSSVNVIRKGREGSRRGLLVGLLGASLLLVLGLVIGLRSRAQPEASLAPSPSSNAAAPDAVPSGREAALSASAAPSTSAPKASAEPKPADSAPQDSADAGSAAPGQPPSGGGSPATPPPRSGDERIPTGKGKIVVFAKGGWCNVTIDGSPRGVTPISAFVRPGMMRVFCTPPGGSVRQAVVMVREGKPVSVTIDVR